MTIGKPSIPFHFYFFGFLGPHLQHMEVPRLGAESQLEPPTYATATATPGLSHVCDLHHSSRQHCVLNSLTKARDLSHSLRSSPIVHARQIRFHGAMTGTLRYPFLK